MSNYSAANRITRRRFVGGLAASALAAGLPAVACGDDDNSESNQQGTTPAAPRQPKAGGVVRYPDSDINEWDYHKMTSTNGFQVSSLAREGLIERSYTPGTDAWDPKVNAALASSWEQPDPLTYVFKIDPRAKFQPVEPLNGRRFTAQDVVYNFEHQVFPKRATWAKGAQLLEIERVVATSDDTVKIVMKNPFAPQLGYLADLDMVAPEFDGKEREPSSTKGTGHMIFEDYKAGVGATFRRNPDWWRAQTYIDKFQMRVIPDINTQLAEFQSGNLDSVGGAVVGQISEDTAKAVISRGAKGNIQAFWQPADYLFKANINYGLWKDQRVRQAVSLSIDRASWLSTWMGWKGESEPGIGAEALGGGVLAYNQQPYAYTRANMPKDILKWITYDLKEAKSLMAAAGLSDGIDIDLIALDYGGDWTARSQAFAEGLKAIGIRAKLTYQDRGQFVATTYLGVDGPAAALNGGGGGPEPDVYVYTYFITGGKLNQVKVSDPKIDALLTKQRQTLNENERAEVWKEFQRYVIPQCLYLYSPARKNPFLVNSALRGYQPSFSSQYRNLRYIWRDD